MKKSKIIIVAGTCVLTVVSFLATKGNRRFTGFNTGYVKNTNIAIQAPGGHFTTSTSGSVVLTLKTGSNSYHLVTAANSSSATTLRWY